MIRFSWQLLFYSYFVRHLIAIKKIDFWYVVYVKNPIIQARIYFEFIFRTSLILDIDFVIYFWLTICHCWNLQIVNRHQKVKIINCHSLWKLTKNGAPKGSILGPAFFNMFLCDVFFDWRCWSCKLRWWKYFKHTRKTST